jgi:hypothetical protein
MKFFIRARHSPQKIRDQSFDGVVRRNGGFSKLITKIGVARAVIEAVAEYRHGSSLSLETLQALRQVDGSSNGTRR